MVLAEKVSVNEGPSRWNMLLSSLWEGKPVRFHLSDKRIRVEGLGRDEWIWVRIVEVCRSGEHQRSPRPIDSWFVTGEVLAPSGGAPLGIVMRGTYEDNSRHGTFTFSEREYHGGDYYFGWRNKEMREGNLIRPSEVVSFIDTYFP